jgi:hypothetical protein
MGYIQPVEFEQAYNEVWTLRPIRSDSPKWVSGDPGDVRYRMCLSTPTRDRNTSAMTGRGSGDHRIVHSMSRRDCAYDTAAGCLRRSTNRRNWWLKSAYETGGFQISACYEKRSLNLTTNLEFSKWVNLFLDEAMTAARIDRLIPSPHIQHDCGYGRRLRPEAHPHRRAGALRDSRSFHSSRIFVAAACRYRAQ